MFTAATVFHAFFLSFSFLNMSGIKLVNRNPPPKIRHIITKVFKLFPISFQNFAFLGTPISLTP